MTVLVTGGAGFIGSHIVDRLLRDSYRIICVDDFNDYYPPQFKRENIVRHLKSSNYKLFEVDIVDKQALEKVFKYEKPSIIVHLAARAGVRASLVNPLLYQHINVLGTTNLLSLSHDYGIKQFIFSSSSSVYGRNTLPFREDDPTNTPLSPYGASKRSAELVCSTFHHLYKIPITIFRFFSVYGPRGRPDMAPYLFTKAILEGKSIRQFGDGSSSRDWTYINDIVNGVFTVIKHPFDFEIINLGSDRPIQLTDFINEIEKAIGKNATITRVSSQSGEMQQTWASIEKARRLLNWKPETSFSDGMRQFIDWYLSHR